MPFDPAPARVVVLPSSERGGGRPQRIHIEIEIIDRRGSRPQQGYRFGTLTLLLLVLAFLIFGYAAHAQDHRWTSYKMGDTTFYNSEDGRWRGSSYQMGTTTFSNFEGPDGQTKRCSSYTLGSTESTDCNR